MPKTTFFGERSRPTKENPKRKEVVESASITPNQPLQNPKLPETEPSPKKAQTSEVDPDTEPLTQAMLASHAYQEDGDDQSIEVSEEISSDNEYADITKIPMATPMEPEISRGTQLSLLNPQEINTPSPSKGPLFIIDDIRPS